jgi:hypothetical protein
MKTEIIATGQNELNKEIKAMLKKLLPELKKFEGKKLTTQKGVVTGFNRKVVQSKNKRFRCYLDFTQYSGWVKCDISKEIGDHTCTYFTKSIHLGDMNIDILEQVKDLKTIIDNCNLNKHFTAERIKKDVLNYEKAKEKANKLYNAMDRNVIEKLHLSR